MTWASRDDDRPGLEPERHDALCDECEREVDEGDVLHAAFGDFCSDACATKYERNLAEYLKRKGFMVVQPDMLSRDDA